MKDDGVEKSLILLVDDVPVNILILEEILTREGYEIATAADGKEAFEQLAQKLPDLILLDVMLPDQSGFEICRKLKADKKTADIPIIFLTALVEVKDKLEGFKAGAVDYVTKPFNGVEILARVKTHIQLKHSRDLVKKYNEQLEMMLAKRTQALIKTEREAAFAQLIQGIVHNMSNPITNIIGSVGMIDMSKERITQLAKDSETLSLQLESVWKYVNLVRRGAQKLDGMVNNMMIKSRRDKSVQVKRVDLNDIIRQELDFYTVAPSSRRNFQKNVNLSEQTLPVEVAPSEIAQIFGNLYKNAGDAMFDQEHANLEIRSGKDGDLAWFSLEDNGPGIPEDISLKIFEPFFSTKSSDKTPHSGPKGTGLGLHYCREISRSYGGDIKMVSEVGKGTVFTVHIPLATVEVE